MSEKMNKALLVLKEIEELMELDSCTGENPTNGHENAFAWILKSIEDGLLSAENIRSINSRDMAKMMNILIGQGCTIKESAMSA